MAKFEGGELTEREDVWDRYTGYVVIKYESQITADRRSRGCKSGFLWCEETGTDPYAATETNVRSYVDDHLALPDTTLSSYFDSIIPVDRD